MKRRAKYPSRIHSPKAEPLWFMVRERRYERDARTLLVAVHRFIRARRYAPSVPEMIAWKGYRERAVREVIRELEDAGLVLCIPPNRFIITPAGSAFIARAHVAPVLPHNSRKRNSLLATIQHRADDEGELDALRAAVGATSYADLYRRLTRSLPP